MTFGFARKFISRLESFLPIGELSIEKNSRTEMLPGKRDFYRCCKARRSASHVNKEFWQQFQNYAPPSLRVIRTKFARTIIGERAKRARHSQVCSIENRGYICIPSSTCKFCSYNP